MQTTLKFLNIGGHSEAMLDVTKNVDLGPFEFLEASRLPLFSCSQKALKGFKNILRLASSF